MNEYEIFDERGTLLAFVREESAAMAVRAHLEDEDVECEGTFYVRGSDGAVTSVHGVAWVPQELAVSVETTGTGHDWEPGLGLRVLPTDGQWLRVGDHDWAVSDALAVRRDCGGWPYQVDWKSVGETPPWRMMPTAESIEAIIGSPEAGELDGLVLQAVFAPVLRSGRAVSIQVGDLLAVKIVNDNGEAIAVVMPLRSDCGPSFDYSTVNHLGEPIGG